ncbi:MAG: hypothetical protein JXR94_02390 [Candidatus Hydrogenedentes bacterium]|nr:hypothetical protein [Candidatus Hydrogenedentota bacterium]
MARIELVIEDPPNRVTVKSLLEAAGHTVVDADADLCIADDPAAAIRAAAARPALVLASAGQIRDAVAAMREGVYGYVFVPFQAGELELMVSRAMGHESSGDAPAVDEVPHPLDEVEYEHIRAVLRHCRNNRAKAARYLGIGRNTLWRKLKRFEERKTQED